MILYVVTRTDAVIIALGLEYTGNISHLGMVSKVVQVGLVIGSIWEPIQTKKEIGLQTEYMSM